MGWVYLDNAVNSHELRVLDRICLYIWLSKLKKHTDVNLPTDKLLLVSFSCFLCHPFFHFKFKVTLCNSSALMQDLASVLQTNSLSARRTHQATVGDKYLFMNKTEQTEKQNVACLWNRDE